MSMFSPIDDDINRARAGQPYVVDSDGWGWAALLLLLVLPVICLFALIVEFSTFFAAHLVLCLVLYLIFTCFLGIFLYRNRANRYRGLGIFSTVITMTPMALITVFYAVPFIILEPGFSSAFDFILLFLLVLGGEILVFSLSQLLKNGMVHLIMSLVFLCLGCLLLFFCISSESRLLTLASIYSVYFL